MNFSGRTIIHSLRLNTLRKSCIFRFSELLRKNNTRTFVSPSNNGFKTIKKLKDNVSSKAYLIYNNSFSATIEFGFHLKRIMFVIISMHFIYTVKLYFEGNLKFPMMFRKEIFIRSETDLILGYSVAYFIILSIIFLCKWTVLRIYFDPTEKVFKTVVVGSLPYLRRIINIKPNSVSIKTRSYLTKEHRTFEYTVDGRRLLMFDDYFKTPSDLYRMLKYIP